MVTPTEKARRSEALYYDNHNITRRTLCDRIVNLESDMEEVKAENSKLREENERFIIKLNAEHIVRQNVESENAKLQELMQDLREHIESDDGFGPDIGWMLDRIHELRVEAS